jgi:hypothetical protein
VNLVTLKERISKNGTCRTPQEAIAKWQIASTDSALSSESTSKTLSVCSNKENSPVTYQLIRPSCAKHMKKSLYIRAASIPARPIIRNVSSLSHESASLTVAVDSSTIETAPITYFTVTTNQGNVTKINSWNDLTLTINGLSSSTSYTFTVSATNADGTSPFSAISPPVTTEAFIAPQPTSVQVISTPPIFTLSSTSETLTASTSALSGYTISSTGGTIASYSISPLAPPGLTFNGLTGVLSGTPTETRAATTYTITGSNSHGSATATFRLRVTGDIGDTGPGGGKIFYVATAPFACGPTLNLMCRYLEAAPTTGTAAWADFYDDYEWSGNVTTEIGTTGTAIGDGLRNTLAIVSLSSAPGKAGTISRAFRGPNDLTDWYLPSKDELNQLYIEKTLVGFYPNTDYWSSSESEAGWAWSQFLDNGVQTRDAKNYPIKVRPIRAF